MVEGHSIFYKQLPRLVLALSSTPASSTTSERIFSDIGRTRRQFLSSDSLDLLYFFITVCHCHIDIFTFLYNPHK